MVEGGGHYIRGVGRTDQVRAGARAGVVVVVTQRSAAATWARTDHGSETLRRHQGTSWNKLLQECYKMAVLQP